MSSKSSEPKAASDSPAKPAPAAAKRPDTFSLSLDEYCRRLSESVREVELIGGFHATERAAGRLSDTEPSFHARFAEFRRRPVA